MRHEVFINTSDGRRSFVVDDAFCQSLKDYSQANIGVMSLFIAGWLSLLADSPLPSGTRPHQTYVRFLDRIRTDGLKSTVLRMISLAHALVSTTTIVGPESSIGDWIDGFKDTPVFFEYNRYYKTGDIESLKYLYTFLNFGKKLEYVDSTFNETAFRGWLDVESRLGDLVLREEDTSVLRTILATLLPRYVVDDFRPKFGPGSVRERGVHGRIGKIKTLRFDPVIDRFLLHGHAGMYGYGEDHGLTVEKIIPDPSQWTPAKGVSSRESLLMFRPKNMKVARSVCMEPNTLMFFQQGIMGQFMELIGQSRLSKLIDIRDQSKNRALSQFGSFSNEIDTLDLSSASDSLSLALVKAVFPPSWLIPMLASRSSSVRLPDGRSISVHKFAPMGSALCFPTQCIIFASVVVYAMCLYVYESRDIHTAFSDWLTPTVIHEVLCLMQDTPGYSNRSFQPCSVYGDDICLDGRLTDIVKSILVRLGFVVNEEKSFVGNQAFRESCGGYYLNGHDITPLYFTVKGVKRLLSSTHVASQVHLINESYARSYRHLYRFLRDSIMTWECGGRLKSKATTSNSIPYVSTPDVFGIVARAPRNSHLESRVSVPYQRDEVRSWTIVYTSITDPGDLLGSVDKYEYVRWWTRRTRGGIEDPYGSALRFDTGNPGLRWRWIPTE